MTLSTTSSTHVKSMEKWSNFHATIEPRDIPLYCTSLTTDMRTHGASIVEVLRYCFQQGERLRTIGARWSLSLVGLPEKVALDIANMEHVNRISDDWLTASYRTTRGKDGYAPVIAQAGATVASLNRRLATVGLALQTSGASDAHRIAGCIATGTHGAAVKVGALHDTVLGLHIVVSPDKAFFVQASERFCKDDVGTWLGSQIGIPTETIADDEVFRAALVSLGAFGFVHAVVIEAAPMYSLRRVIKYSHWEAQEPWDAISRLSTTEIPDPYHVQVIFNPYPDPEVSSKQTAAINVMKKCDALEGETPPTSTARAVINSDMMSLIGGILSSQMGAGVTWAVRGIIRSQIRKIYPESDIRRFPGNMFGPTTLAPGPAASTEIFFDQTTARTTLTLIRDTLHNAANQKGLLLAGGLGVRVMKGTNALLGMNRWPLTCSIEIPSLKTSYVQELYLLVYMALQERGIPYVCHWGQQHRMTPGHVRRMYGSSVDAWTRARNRLLDTTGRHVFSTPYVEQLGLV